MKTYCIYLLTLGFLAFGNILAQEMPTSENDSLGKKAKNIDETKVQSKKSEIQLTIRNVDISRFPEVSVIVEAFNTLGEPLDTLYSNELTVLENGHERKVIQVQKISLNERVPVDFIFLIDITGSMQNYIDGVQSNISYFTSSLVKRGIDYRVGLVLFGDQIEKAYPPTQDVNEFRRWLAPVRAEGGLDEKENALQAIDEAVRFNFRPSANKVFVLITDAPYHQKGEDGNGTTMYTTQTATELLTKKEVRLFCIVPERLEQYAKMAAKTRGSVFDIQMPFSVILDNFSTQLTNLYALKYRSEEAALPDSIEIGILDGNKEQIVKKTIPIVEIGRKLIIEHLLFGVASSGLPDNVPELDVLHEFMKNKPKVVIQIEGHTDAQGGDAANKKLSLLRAQAVKDYLIKKGIDARRMRTVGFGKSRPIGNNATEFGRRINRRTEVVIVSK